jgi:DNA-binding beta-propeller fold protein YncE
VRKGFSLALLAAATLTACPAPNHSTPGGLTGVIQNLVATRTLATGKGPHGMAISGNVLVQANPAGGDIDLFDADKESLIKKLTLSDGLTGAASASPGFTKTTHDGNYTVTLDSGAKALRVLKPSEARQVGFVSVEPYTTGSKLVWESDTVAYVSLSGKAGRANLMKVDWSEGFEKAPRTENFEVSNPKLAEALAANVAVGGGFVGVPAPSNNSVSFAPLSNLKDVTTLELGNNPGPIDIAIRDGKPYLVYGNRNSNTFVIYDLTAKKELATLAVGATPTDMVVRADGKFAYCTCRGAGTLGIVDLVNLKVAHEVKMGFGLADKPSNPVHTFLANTPGSDSVQAWIGGDGDDSVTVIDTLGNSQLALVRIGKGHHKMAFTATKAFVSNITDNTISVVDRASIK